MQLKRIAMQSGNDTTMHHGHLMISAWKTELTKSLLRQEKKRIETKIFFYNEWEPF